MFESTSSTFSGWNNLTEYPTNLQTTLLFFSPEQTHLYFQIRRYKEITKSLSQLLYRTSENLLFDHLNEGLVFKIMIVIGTSPKSADEWLLPLTALFYGWRCSRGWSWAGTWGSGLDTPTETWFHAWAASTECSMKGNEHPVPSAHSHLLCACLCPCLLLTFLPCPLLWDGETQLADCFLFTPRL